jgi:hypothetical protein
LNMLEIPIEPQLFQNLAHLLVINFGYHILDSLFLDSPTDCFNDVGWNLRRFFCLELC